MLLETSQPHGPRTSMLALKQRGEPTGDADILIGASALVHGLIVMSNDEDHFRWIRGLDTDNGLGS